MLAVRRDTLSLVAYFESPPADIVRMIRMAQQMAAQILGDIEIKTLVFKWGETDAKKRTSEAKESLRRCEALETCIGPPDSFNYNAWNEPPDANRYRKDFGIVEKDWSIEYDARPRMRERLSPWLRMDFVVGRFPHEQLPAISEAAIQYAHLVAAAPEFCSGLFDIGDIYEISYGDEYSSTGIGWVNAQRQLARQCWIQSGEQRRHMARGVFWGNLFGPRMVAALGGDAFIREYRTLRGYREMDELCIELPHGCHLLLLSRNCKWLMNPPMVAAGLWQRRGVWLHKRLLAAGLLC